MALVIDASPLSPTCNSYASSEFMADYVSTRVPDPTAVSTWNALTADQKAMYLVNATRSLDGAVDWIGDRYSRDQVLAWPRINAIYDRFYIEPTIFPRQVIEATAEMALWMASNAGATSVSQNLSFDAIQVGPLKIDFNEGAGGSSEEYFPDIIGFLLKGLGSINNPALPGVSMARNFTVIRA